MLHGVLPASHPDGLYATIDDHVLRATAAPSEVVPADDVRQQFRIRTHCRCDDEIFQLREQHADDSLTLCWIARDAEMARQLGLTRADGDTGFTMTVVPEQIDALWQERLDVGGTARADGDPSAILRQIGRTLRDMRPEGGTGIAAQFRQVGGYAELEIRAVVGDMSYSLAAPAALSQLFSDLRAVMYEPGKGTWFQGTYTLDADNHFDFAYDTVGQPDWRLAPDGDHTTSAEAFAAELTRFPRESELTPRWLAARAGLPLDVTFRHARCVERHTPGQQPIVNRKPVPPHEVQRVLAYLYRCPVVLAEQRPEPDIFAPQAAPSVPHAFHTDGTWIWPAAVPHYLRFHGVAPEQDLLDQIRGKLYRPPFVSQKLRETAAAELTGKPYPPQSAADLDEHDPVSEVERDDTARPALRASEILTLLRKRLDEMGAAPDAYRIGDVAEQAWCLRRVGTGWQVALHADGADHKAERFSTISAAAAHLLGVLSLHPTRALAAPDAAEVSTDWPIQPLRGEPPLTFFRGKRVVTLQSGTRLTRFGDESGNLMHEACASFSETALNPDRARVKRSYRVARPLRVLTGVTLPRDGMPGGALAYLLPAAVAHHVKTGAVTRE